MAFLSYLAAFLLFNIVFNQPNVIIANMDPDERRDAIEIIESRGFKGETHHITTRDGYILAIHRIVNPLIPNSNKPVLLQHGLIASSTDFIINSPGDGLTEPLENAAEGKNLGFVLSRLGYDVWLGNCRGNTYSRNHTSLNADTGSKR